MKQEVWGKVIKIVHMCIVAFMVIAPFTNNCSAVFIHSIGVPFLYLHWILNNDTCALTELEKLVTGKKCNEDTFVGSIVSPVYKLESNDIKIITLMLWMVSVSKVMKCPNEVILKMLVPTYKR
jgi:hypothetical protein